MVRAATRTFIVLVSLIGSTSAWGATPPDDQGTGMRLVGMADIGHTTEIAFRGKLGFAAIRNVEDPRRDALVVLDLADPGAPREIGRLVCAGSHPDVSVWRDLVFLSVDGGDGSWDGEACDAAPAESGSEDAFAGIRVVSVKDPANPVQIAAVPTNCGFGSHTHTLLPDPADARRLLVYANNACETVVEVPLDAPEEASVVAEYPHLSCHDLTFFVPRALGACSSIGSTLLWDMTEPERPRPLSAVVNGASVPFSTHHSSAFSWDGRTLVIGDEINSPVLECHAGQQDPGSRTKGALWFHDISDPRAPILEGSYQLEQRPPEGRYCSSHYFTVIPVRGDRDILTSAWYGGGVTVVDFTDPSQPQQLAHFIAAPDDPSRHSFVYDGYWYNGFVYATNTQEPFYGETSTLRSLDVLRVDDGIIPRWICTRGLNAQTQIGEPEWRGGACGVGTARGMAGPAVSVAEGL